MHRLGTDSEALTSSWRFISRTTRVNGQLNSTCSTWRSMFTVSNVFSNVTPPASWSRVSGVGVPLATTLRDTTWSGQFPSLRFRHGLGQYSQGSTISRSLELCWKLQEMRICLWPMRRSKEGTKANSSYTTSLPSGRWKIGKDVEKQPHWKFKLFTEWGS